MKQLFPYTQKKCALLLELIIALALVTICLMPLLKPHLAIQKLRRASYETTRWDCIAPVVAVELKAKLYENQIPWEAMRKKCTGIVRLDNYEVTYNFVPLREYRQSSSERNYLYLRLDLKCKEISHATPYSTYLFIEKRAEREAS